MSHDSLFYYSGDSDYYPYSVDMSFDPSNKSKWDFYLRWVELWLQSKCQAGWRLEAFERPIYHGITGIRIYFQNPQECMYFKLSPTYQPIVREFLTY